MKMLQNFNKHRGFNMLIFKESLLIEVKNFSDEKIKQNIEKGIIEADNFEFRCMVYWEKRSREDSLLPPEFVETVIFINPSFMKPDYALIRKTLDNIESTKGFEMYKNFKIIE